MQGTATRRYEIGAIVLCAAIIITTFLACGMQLLVPVADAVVGADNKTQSRDVDVQKNNNSLTHLKWIQKKIKTAQRLM